MSAGTAISPKPRARDVGGALRPKAPTPGPEANYAALFLSFYARAKRAKTTKRHYERGTGSCCATTSTQPHIRSAFTETRLNRGIMAMRPSASKHHSPPPLPSPFSTTPRHHSVGPRPLVKKRKSINAGVLPRQKRAKGQGVAGREKKGPGAVKCERRSATLADIPGCPVFRPSDQEFQDFHEYVRSIHHEAKKHGICKIIPPNTWLERHRPKFRIPAKKFGYKRQTFHRWNNGSQVSSIESEVPISYKDFLKAAKSSAKSGEYKALGKNAEASAADIEREYWQWLETPRPKPAEVLYASDGALSIFPEPKKKKSRTKSSTTSLATKNCKKGREDDDISARTEEKEAEKEAEESQWNLKAISRLPKGLLRFVEKDVPGVTEPYSYIGTRFSTFCWHVEDDNLYSLSFLHGGAPKTWYGVPSTAARLVEDVYASVFPTLGKNGHGLAKKTSMFCPTKLAEKGGNRQPHSKPTTSHTTKTIPKISTQTPTKQQKEKTIKNKERTKTKKTKKTKNKREEASHLR